MKALAFAMGVAFAMLAVSIPIAYVAIPTEHRGFQGPAVYFMLVPILAAMLMVGSALIVPNLFAPYRLSFPLNVTLPVVYGFLLVVSSSLMTHMPTALEQVPPILAPVLGWQNPQLLLQVAAGQFVVMSLLVLMARKPKSV